MSTNGNGNGGPNWKWLTGILLTMVLAAISYVVQANDQKIRDLERAGQMRDIRINSLTSELEVIKFKLEMIQNQLNRMDGKLDQLALDRQQSKKNRD